MQLFWLAAKENYNFNQADTENPYGYMANGKQCTKYRLICVLYLVQGSVLYEV